MRFDKETLLKHRFWVLLSGVFPLIIVAVVVLMTVVTASINADLKTLQGALAAAKAPGGEPRNEDYIKVMKEIADEFQAMQDGVWKEVYLPQKPITEAYNAWPPAFNDIFHYHDGLFAKKIHVYRNTKAPEAPADGRTYFQGVVKQVDRDFIVVDGAGAEFKTPGQKFLRSFNVRVTSAEDNKAMMFFDIRPNDSVLLSYQRGKYFNDPLTDSERERYPRDYTQLIPPIIEQVEPVIGDKGEGVVQLKDWLPKKGERLLPPPTSPFLRSVPQHLWQDNANKDYSNDAWIAQEDLWIQREMFRLVRLANDYVSRFNYKNSGDGVGSPYVCYNPYWQLDMKLDKDKDELQVKITNLTAQRLPLDVNFWINFTAKDAEQQAKKLSAAEWGDYRQKTFEKVLLTGEPVNPVTFKDNFQMVKVQLPPGVPRTQIFGVEQVLNWKTAAVKRIDAIDIGAHSHRTIVKGTKPFKDKAPDPNAPPPPPDSGQPNVTPRLPNAFGLLVDRYCEVTPQARRLPVAISLIIDQQHTNRVLAAFANSDLRLVITQVLHNNYPHNVRPQISDQGKVPVIGLPPPHGEGPVIIGRPPQGAGATEEQETNVEIVIYGIISLYERHPPRIPDPEDNVPPVAQPGVVPAPMS